MAHNGGEEASLTLEAIDAVDDVVEAMCLAEDHGVNIDGLETVEEIQQRLRCHARLREGNPKDKLIAKICRLGEKDNFERGQLIRLVDQVRRAFPSQGVGTTTMGQHLMEDLLSQDGTTADIRADCDRRLHSLAAKESVLLVAGESSAGKSSLLNLLLGEAILPSHTLPCTSCITVIRYSGHRCARILHRDGRLTKIDRLDRAGLEQLQARAYFSQSRDGRSEQEVYEEMGEEHNIAEIQVFLPLDLLKSGLVLVDTPGVGENEFLENYLMEYIYSHQILGFLYIVMTDNALGVAEDRLVNLMSLIIKSQRNSTEVVKFDPKAALFVCNRWDKVLTNRAAVRRTTLRQLGRCWPEFDESQAVFFSTYKAEQESRVNPGYVTDDYQALLQALYKLTKVSLDKRIKASYSWLGTVLQRLVHYLKTMVRRLDMSSRDRQAKTEAIHKKLKLLRSKAETVVERLRQNVEEAVKDICAQIRVYLQSPQARKKLTKDWGKKDGELPDAERSHGTWEWIKRRLEAAFHDRLTNLLEDWDQDKKHISNLEKQLFRDAKLQLCELEADLSQLEDEVSEDALNASRISRASILNNMCKTFEDFEIEEMLDTEVPEKILHRIMRFVTKKGKQRLDNQKLDIFKANPILAAEHRSEKLLAQMVKGKDNSLEEFVREMMVRPFGYIRKLESKIPSMVKSNITLLDKFEKEIVEQSKRRGEFLATMERVENIRSELIKYGEGHFFVNDFTPEDIDLLVTPKTHKHMPRKASIQDLMKLQSSTANSNSLPIPQGLWHAVYPGKVVKIGSQGQYVSVKIYNRDLKIANSAQEIAKLRCLLPNDVCVAEFLGVYQQRDPPIPAHIYRGHLVALRHFLADHAEADDGRLLVEVLSGLQYVHSKGLVHMELNRDTVTVDDSGNVKLTGACLPRRVEESDSRPCRAHVYVCPDVLQGGVYISKSDMYSFALMALEVRDAHFTAFMEERTMPLKSFAELNHRALMEQHVRASSFPSGVQRRLLQCLDRDLKERPNAVDLSADLQAALQATRIVRRTAAPRTLWKTFSTRKK